MADPAAEDRRGAAVHAQYEAFPYPERDPAEEASRLVTGSPSRVAELNHYVFGGRRDFSRPFRVLVAGGGTGDATVQLAQQLADLACPAEIVQLDLSAASMAVAEARIAARGLSARFVQGSLLEVGTLAPGPWDYVDCCGVLHHLPDPVAGLQALSSVLAPDGGMGLMVYAPLGRTGVYDAQEMLRMLLSGERAARQEPSPKAELGIAKRLLAALPGGNRLKRNPVIADHLQAGDAGLYDLLLHSIDRAYRVPELFDLADRAGLAISGLIDPVLYDPATWIGDRALLEKLAAHPWPDRAAFAELAAGVLRKHIFYVVPAASVENAVAKITPAACPVADGFDATALATKLRPGAKITLSVDTARLDVVPPPLAGPILRLCDGGRTLQDIHTELPGVQGGAKVSWQAFESQFAALFGMLNATGRMFLATRDAA